MTGKIIFMSYKLYFIFDSSQNIHYLIMKLFLLPLYGICCHSNSDLVSIPDNSSAFIGPVAFAVDERLLSKMYLMVQHMEYGQTYGSKLTKNIRENSSNYRYKFANFEPQKDRGERRSETS